jgi:hypothetical protein
MQPPTAAYGRFEKDATNGADFINFPDGVAPCSAQAAKSSISRIYL